MTRRCSPETARALLAASGTIVSIHEPELTEDADGLPLGVRVETSTAMLYVTPELLGYTLAELGIEDDA